jgi:hypothetical protein
LLLLCDPLVQIQTRRVRDIQENRELAESAYDQCADRMCRLVQWFKPEIQCRTDAKSTPSP